MTNKRRSAAQLGFTNTAQLAVACCMAAILGGCGNPEDPVGQWQGVVQGDYDPDRLDLSARGEGLFGTATLHAVLDVERAGTRRPLASLITFEVSGKQVEEGRYRLQFACRSSKILEEGRAEDCSEHEDLVAICGVGGEGSQLDCAMYNAWSDFDFDLSWVRIPEVVAR
jgi:hypothetical protein